MSIYEQLTEILNQEAFWDGQYASFQINIPDGSHVAILPAADEFVWELAMSGTAKEVSVKYRNEDDARSKLRIRLLELVEHEAEKVSKPITTMID